MKYKDDMVFLKNSGGIRSVDYDFLVWFTEVYNIKTVLEFGPGASTYAFLENDCQIDSLEYKTNWFNKFKIDMEIFESVEVIKFENTDWEDDIVSPVLDKSYHMAFVDSPVGLHKGECSRLNSMKYCMDKTDIILLHDICRKGEMKTAKYMQDNGWNFICVDSAKTGIFYKGIELDEKHIIEWNV